MNNEQFRKLMLASSAKSSSSKDGSSSTRQPAQGSTLGSRLKANIPMTPRSVGGQSSFARQLAEQRQSEHPSKKFKTSAPKGVKLASGYVDRARTREEEEDDRAARLKALEQSLKDEEIDQATFDKLRYEIAGGDLESTHLVKGLDFKLLERVRKGEDVYSGNQDDEQSPTGEELDVDDEFDQLEDKEVQAVEKEKSEKKKGQLSTVALAPGKKRTRDQILAELKAARQAAKTKTEPALGDRFRKIGGKQMPGSRIERDSKGREVLIIIDEDGHEKRKVRKVQPGAAQKEAELTPDPTSKPLGMEVPEQYRKQEAEEEDDGDVDIFDNVGDDYDPLAGMNDSDEDSDEDNGKDTKSEASADTSMPPPPKPQPATKQNYFQNSKTGLMSEETSKAPSMSDPAIMAAIKRASALRPIGGDRDEADSGDDDDEEAKKAKANEERRKRLLDNTDRDAEDMDMGFGTSRYEDEEDFDDQKIKLSKWGGGDDDDGGEGGGKSKRKRGPKKRKGDVNSAEDVLRVMEQRKNE